MVYYKKPVTIEEAINIDHEKVKRIKIEFLNGEKLVLDSVYYRGHELYGSLFKSNRATETEIKLDEDEIIKIQLHNRGGSRELTFLIIIAL
jgi:hypothetical protein